jgi:hypothetical protein
MLVSSIFLVSFVVVAFSVKYKAIAKIIIMVII